MKPRTVTYFVKCLATSSLIPPSLLFLPSLTIWAVPLARSCRVVWFLYFGRSTTTPMCTLQASGSLILKIWNVVVPIHPSENAASHSAFQQPCVPWSGIHACSRLTHHVDVFHWNSELVSLFGRTSWIDVFGDAFNAVTTHCSRSIFRFPLRSLFLHVFLLTMKIEAKKGPERPTKSSE